MSKFNFLDSKSSKEESAIGLGIFIVGGLATVLFADYGFVIVGINQSLVVPSEVGEYVKTAGIALLTFIVGKQVGQNLKEKKEE